MLLSDRACPVGFQAMARRFAALKVSLWDPQSAGVLMGPGEDGDGLRGLMVREGIIVPGDTARHRPVEHPRPTDATVKELYATALRCGRLGCIQQLYRVSETGVRVLNSQVAHIHARRENGPRWNPAMTGEENRAYGNLIVLCLEHASEIDITPERFPAQVLREWKRVQVATQELAARFRPPLTDAEAAEVIGRSFGLDEMVAAVSAVVPFSARSRTRDEALDRAVRESFGRRTTRLLGVPSDRQDAVLAWMAEQDDPVVEVPEGQIRVLVAPMGAGKSEHASRWWDEGLSAAQVDGQLEIPVWLDARRVPMGLDVAVAASIGRDPVRPCRIVIDNLDGVSPGEAGQLLDEARQLVRTWPQTRVLATSRPGVTVGKDEFLTIEPWPAKRGIDLVRVVTGDTGWHSWTTETADLLTSPLTTIAVAAQLLKGRDVRVSRLTLLMQLAQTIIQQKRPDHATPQIWDELARLANRILSDPGPVTAASFGNDAQVWQLTDTGLVVNDAGALRFALPLFEQHFGAHALTCGIATMEEVAAPETFPRWRYAVAFALSTTQPGQSEQFMLRLARTNPAVVSWTLNELIDNDLALAGSESAGTSQSWQSAAARSRQPGDPAIAEGKRLREALQALLDGFGACGSMLARHRDGRLVQWGVQLLGDEWIALSEARDTLPPPDLVTVAGDSWDRKSPEWIRRTMFPIPREPLGRWSWARNWLRKRLAELIQERRLPLPSDSPLASEREWILARRIMQLAGKPHLTVILLADLQQAVDNMMEKVDRTVHSTWSGGGMRIDSDDIRWIHARLQLEKGDQLTPRWPAPDQSHVWPRFLWQCYSPELSRAITTEVLGDAVTGYRDLVAENFAAFGWALGLNSALPVRVEGTLVIPDDDADGERASLHYQLKPVGPDDRDGVSHVHLDLVTQPGAGRRDARIAAWPYDRRRSPFYVPTSYNTQPFTGQSRPATNLAYQWLAADLHAVGWLTRAIVFHD